MSSRNLRVHKVSNPVGATSRRIKVFRGFSLSFTTAREIPGNGLEANKIVFEGIVSVALGFKIHLGDALAVAELKFDAKLVRGTPPAPDSGDCRGHD